MAGFQASHEVIPLEDFAQPDSHSERSLPLESFYENCNSTNCKLIMQIDLLFSIQLYCCINSSNRFFNLTFSAEYFLSSAKFCFSFESAFVLNIHS